MAHKLTSEADVHALVEEARQYKAAGHVSAANQSEFCKLWPDIEKGLDLLKTIFPVASIAVDAVEGVGNVICKGATAKHA
ncbi:MAG TPA: hypothetical protein VHY79_13295 [Rhizomicrobium sp.]|jgi:hypothetical protein|nr:hypothetical protein [Rhizomicrobium sp.]